MKRIGMLTSGGDCQALNAAMRGVVKSLINSKEDVEIYGFLNGYRGLIYGDFKMMFTGDGEGPEEKDILAALGGADIHSQVLKAGHHGSKTSSSKEWLRAVNPEVGLISCGAGNDYGHPHKETLKKYQALKMKVYETDKNGTITLTSDGKTYERAVEKGDVQ